MSQSRLMLVNLLLLNDCYSEWKDTVCRLRSSAPHIVSGEFVLWHGLSIERLLKCIQDHVCIHVDIFPPTIARENTSIINEG